MIGYQADMGQQYWGCLYDESRRNKVLAQPDAEMLRKALKAGDWNEYVIRCVGPRIQLWLNGVQTVDYTEPDKSIEQTGLIGVQIHAGPPAEAWYKDIHDSDNRDASSERECASMQIRSGLCRGVFDDGWREWHRSRLGSGCSKERPTSAR